MKNNIYVRAWRGELSQSIAFWVVFVVTIAVLLIISILIFPNYVYGIVGSLYSMYGAVCVIRCGRKYRKELMSNLKGFKLYTILFISNLYNFLVVLFMCLMVLTILSYF